MSPAEVGLWMARTAQFVPEIIEAWNAITGDTPQPDRELASAMELIRAIAAAKAREELGK